MGRCGRWLWTVALLTITLPAWAGPPQVSPAKVVLGKVEKREVAPTVSYPGTLHFRHLSRVAAEVPGRVVEVFVEEGDRVKKGAPLVKLDTQLLREELRRLGGEVDEAKALLEKAKADLKRAKAAYEKEAISPQLFDSKRFSARSLEGKVRSLEAARRSVTIRLRKSTVRAPFAGVVLKRFVEVGDWVSQGSPVARLAEFRQMEAVVPVPASSISRALRPGTGVTLKVPALEKTVRGRVYSVVPQGDPSSRTYPVKVLVDNPHASLMDGMEVIALLPTGEPREVLMVPRDAVVQMGQQELVFTVKEGKAAVVPVKVTGYQETMAEVVSEYLKDGMPVVVKGNERLRPGQPVVIVSANPHPAGERRPPVQGQR